jgi:hypothetical protein
MSFQDKLAARKAVQAATIEAGKGYVTIGEDSITVGRFPKGSLGDQMARNRRVIPFAEIGSVSVGGNDKKYMTGKRAAGALAAGAIALPAAGIALLAPRRVRGALVIGLVSGEVIELILKGKDAKRPEAIAMMFGLKGIEVV